MTHKDEQHNEELALKMREAGIPYERIAASLGLTPQEAVAAVDKAIDSSVADTTRREAVIAVRQLEAILRGLYQRAVNGDDKATDRALRILERRSALLKEIEQADKRPKNYKDFTRRR